MPSAEALKIARLVGAEFEPVHEPAEPSSDDIPSVSSFEAYGDMRGDADLDIEQALELEQKAATAEESDCLQEWDAGEETESPPPP
jgi:hypothetical protein